MIKTFLSVFTVIIFAFSTNAFAWRGYDGHSYRGGYYGHSHYRSYSYPRYHGYYGHHRYYDGLAGLAAGLIIGSAVTYSMLPPPPRTVYVAPVTYQQQVVVTQPRVCTEQRVVSGEWQRSPHDGATVWVAFPYPMTRSFQVPCY